MHGPRRSVDVEFVRRRRGLVVVLEVKNGGLRHGQILLQRRPAGLVQRQPHVV